MAADEKAARTLVDEAPIVEEPPSLRILVADDNRDAAESLTMLLQMDGHVVNTVFDGEAAVRAAVAFRPHIVFLDVGMPKLAGNEAAQRIRDQSSANGTLLVALTG
ncbi:MAG: response regulator, partial [Gammaproteobacteria bacterium]|nr:response regulator [Gammaproteobacteria bacterium]